MSKWQFYDVEEPEKHDLSISLDWVFIHILYLNRKLNEQDVFLAFLYVYI